MDKRGATCRALIVGLLIVGSLLLAALSTTDAGALVPSPAAARQEPPAGGGSRLPGIELARTISATTGIAISPLLGLSAVGAWHYYRTPPENRHTLPWFASFWLWGPGLLLSGLIIAKDLVLGFLPILKKPLDALELLENQASAILATPAVIWLFLAAFSTLAGADPELASADVTGALYAMLLIPILVGFFTVWLTGHAINVLIFLSPFGPLDIALRAIKLGILGVLVTATLVHPFAGALVSLLLFLIALLIAGWSFRLTVFGSVLGWDLLSRRHRAFDPAAHETVAFTVTDLEAAPKRTFGRVETGDDGLALVYRPWLVRRPRRVPLPGGDYRLARGMLCPNLRRSGPRGTASVLRFPPRYRSHEAWLAERLGLAEVEDMPLLRGLKAAFAWFREGRTGPGFEARGA